ncbi:MAG: hypothetical protein HYZ54_08300 [Ignavibacteriae bacterium]|nr:hypothetical protein [Ignavibacteriota bacterium]
MKRNRLRSILINIFAFLSLITIISSLYSCERLRNKWERRERKLHYLQEEIDSARKLETHVQDSVWRALDSAKQKKQ